MAKYSALFYLLESAFRSVMLKEPWDLKPIIEVTDVKYVHMANTLVFGVFFQTVLSVCDTVNRSDADKKVRSMLLLKGY